VMLACYMMIVVLKLLTQKLT